MSNIAKKKLLADYKAPNLWSLVLTAANEWDFLKELEKKCSDIKGDSNGVSVATRPTVILLLYAYSLILSIPRRDVLEFIEDAENDNDIKTKVLADLSVLENSVFRKYDSVANQYVPVNFHAVNIVAPAMINKIAKNQQSLSKVKNQKSLSNELNAQYKDTLRILLKWYANNSSLGLDKQCIVASDEEGIKAEIDELESASLIYEGMFLFAAQILFNDNEFDSFCEKNDSDGKDYDEYKCCNPDELKTIRECRKTVTELLGIMYCEDVRLDVPMGEYKPGKSNLEAELKKRIYGQNAALRKFLKAYKRIDTSKRKGTKPKAVFLLAGPPGVGKTYLAETVAEIMDMHYERFDMTEYSGEDNSSVDGLVGFEFTYNNAKPGRLTFAVETYPNSIIVFDEVEKASLAVRNLFLQVINDGRLTDKFTKRTVSFENTILFFTTNAGRDFYEGNKKVNLSMLPQKDIVEALREDNSFPNELVSRFAANTIIMFNHISGCYLFDIALNEIKRAADEYDFCIDHPEQLASVVVLSEGLEADARTIKSRASEMIEDADLIYKEFFNDILEDLGDLVEYYEAKEPSEYDYGSREGIHIEIDHEIRDKSDNFAYDYLFPNKAELVSIIYFHSYPFMNQDVKKMISKQFDDWIELDFVDTYEKMKEAVKKKSYDMIVIDPIADEPEDSEDNKIFKDVSGIGIASINMKSGGNDCIKELLKEGYDNVYFTHNTRPSVENYYLENGAAGKLSLIIDCTDPTPDFFADYELKLFPKNNDWIMTARKCHTVRSMKKLKNLTFNYEIYPDSKNPSEKMSVGNFTLTQVKTVNSRTEDK